MSNEKCAHHHCRIAELVFDEVVLVNHSLLVIADYLKVITALSDGIIGTSEPTEKCSAKAQPCSC